MSIYLIGDVQGCDGALARLLDTVGFSPSRDTLYLLGDLVNRGPDSAAVLRRLMKLEGSAQGLLGNHDLSLLALAAGLRRPHRLDTLDDLLAAPDRHALLDWLRHRPMALQAHGILMVHAGVLPQWTAQRTLQLAAEVETVLRGPDLHHFLGQMYGNQPDHWDDALQGADRLRAIVNALTRLRFVAPDGVMDLKTTGGLAATPAGHVPWFDAPGRQTAGDVIAFGHWSTLGWQARRDVLSLDTGCVWGGCLSALRLGADRSADELIQVRCEAAQPPGE